MINCPDCRYVEVTALDDWEPQYIPSRLCPLHTPDPTPAELLALADRIQRDRHRALITDLADADARLASPPV